MLWLITGFDFIFFRFTIDVSRVIELTSAASIDGSVGFIDAWYPKPSAAMAAIKMISILIGN